MEVASRGFVYFDHNVITMVSNNTQVGCGVETMLSWY